MESLRYDKKVRSLAQWSLASEVWFSKSRGPKKGQTKKGEPLGRQRKDWVSSLVGRGGLVRHVWLLVFFGGGGRKGGGVLLLCGVKG